MSSLIRMFLSLFFLAGAFFLTSCASKEAQETSIPWSRPADWEGRIPGMGAP